MLAQSGSVWIIHSFNRAAVCAARRCECVFLFDERAACNTQDIEVKVQYILHEDNSRLLPENPVYRLCLLCTSSQHVGKALMCCLLVLIGWRRSLFSLFLFSALILNKRE